MKAYLINPKDETITVVDYDNSDYKNISKMIDAHWFTTVQISDNMDTMYLDDEGLLHNGEKYNFTLHNGEIYDLARDTRLLRTYIGKGLVLGCDDEGESCEPEITLEELKNRIDFNCYVIGEKK